MSGWGLMSGRRWHKYRKLQGVPATLESQQECNSKWAQLRRNVTNNMLCARVRKPPLGSRRKGGYCPGSGDPLVCKSSSNGDQYLCGISSWGLPCTAFRRRNNLPEVYTDLSKYHQWITGHMQALWQEYQSNNLFTYLSVALDQIP